MHKAIDVRIAEQSDEKKWNRFIKDKKGISSSHVYGWGRAVEKTYRHSSYYLIAEQNEQVVGVLPLVYMKIPFFRGQMVSLPYCDECDMIVTSDMAGNLLIHRAISIAHELKAGFVELRGATYGYYISSLDLPVSKLTNKVRMVLELPSSSQELWKQFKSKLRSQIRKAERNGLRFQWATYDDIIAFYRIFCVNMRDLGSPVHSMRWFENLLRCYGEDMRIGLVYYSNRPVGGGVILAAGEKIQILWASTLRDFNRLAPNMLLYWKLLEFASDNGYGQFDFGRSTPGEGTYKFKLQWGAIPEPLKWYRIYMDRKVDGKNKSNSGTRSIVAQIWQRLPLPIANCLGPKIRGYISL
jgi:FemAB-related protein (PEP-CTERM system-associated)